MPEMDENKIDLKEWTRRISEEEMPVFAHTAKSIVSASVEEDTSTSELAHLILRDSTMTARILRLANSAYYNPSNQPVNTISRAIVFLGFSVVRNMALTISILEPLIRGIQHEHALTELARSFHAAIQAKHISQQRGNNNPEAIFLAALLSRIGHIAFWCFPYGHAVTLNKAYQQCEAPSMAEETTLGFQLKQLTLSLNNEWHLSPLLAEYLKGKNNTDPLMQDLTQADELALAVEEGWGSLNVKTSIAAIAEHIELSVEDTTELVERGAYEAAQMALEYGAEAASQLIPLPQTDAEINNTISAPLMQDHTLQLNILRELTTMLHEKTDLNAVLGMIIEGIYRALNMERTVVAFVSPADDILRAKYVLGDNNEKLQKQFLFSNKEANLFSHLLKSKNPFWCNAQTKKEIQSYINEELKTCLGTLDFFAMPIWIGNQGGGIIYADCKLTGRQLTAEEFQTFTHFSEYASIAFDLLIIKKG